MIWREGFGRWMWGGEMVGVEKVGRVGVLGD